MKEEIKMTASKLIHNNEKGMVLQTALIFLTIIALLGSTAVMVTTTDIKIGANHKINQQALFAAEAGIAEARARLRGPSSGANYAGDPAASVDPWWSAYILTSNSWQTSTDPDYQAGYKNYIPASGTHTNTTISVNSLQTDISYFVKIRHKREYDAEQAGHTTSSLHYYDGDGSTSTHTPASPGNVVYWGYGDPSDATTAKQFATSGATEHKPVDIITAYGISGSSVNIIAVEVITPPGPPVKSALYAKGSVTGNGSSLSISGVDNCGSAPSVSPIYTVSPSTTTLNGSPTMEGDPPSPTSGPDDFDIVDYVNTLKSSATEIITADQNGTNFGTSSNFVTLYSDTSNPYNVGGLKLQNLTGYGILLVEGDLVLGGGINWNGLILVTGVLTFNGGGSGVNILGTVLANQTVSINGGFDILYDSCMMDDALNTQSRKIISWRQVY